MLRKLVPEADHCGALLATALGSLFVGRDSKALLVVWSGVIVSGNELAADLCGCSKDRLTGMQLAALLPHQPAMDPASRSVRWDTTLVAADGSEILVEAVREPLPYLLGDVWVYALRDYRERKADLLAIALEGLFVGRDRKALIVARAGTIIRVNRLASDLLDRPSERLVDESLVAEFFTEPALPVQFSDSEPARWKTTLKSGAGELVPVEIVREPLGTRFRDVLVYAIRDLRLH